MNNADAAVRPGRFITFEGGEGGGKTTQCRRFAASLAARGVAVVAVREPGGTPLGESVRALLKEPGGDAPCDRAELMLFLAARAQLAERVVRPALAAGKWVVADRFADSTLAYQGAGRGLDAAFVEAAVRFACDGLEPDLTFVLDVPGDVARERLGRRGEAADRIELAGEEFHRRIRAAFLDIARRNPRRVEVIDASADEDAVAAEALRIAASRFGI